MIKSIKGTIDSIIDNTIVIENNGIGYSIQTTLSTIKKFSDVNGQVKIYTYMSVREDNISLFGFYSIEELNMFNKLITVSGVGPKGALGLLEAVSVADIALAIITSDIKTISLGNGIGKKTAERIILELRDKISSGEAINTDILNGPISETVENQEVQDAIEALVILGFSRRDVVKNVIEVNDGHMTSDKIISLALKKFGN